MSCNFWERSGDRNYFGRMPFRQNASPLAIFSPLGESNNLKLSTYIFPNAKAVGEQNFCMNCTLRAARRSHLVIAQTFRNCWFYEVRLIVLLKIFQWIFSNNVYPYWVPKGQNHIRKMIECFSRVWVEGIHSSRYCITVKDLFKK